MKETTVVWAKLFLILLILAKPLGLKGHKECKRLGNNSCFNDSECCSGYCYKEPGWGLGVCKKPRSNERPVESNKKKHTDSAQDSAQDSAPDSAPYSAPYSAQDSAEDAPRPVMNTIYQKGICSYYPGNELTANGDRFDENEMTAAHPTLPFDTIVRVEIMGASVVVKINDRKPTSDGRILLLSRAASENLHIHERSNPVPCQLIVTEVGCIENFRNTCENDHDCCSDSCFIDVSSRKGYCIPK